MSSTTLKLIWLASLALLAIASYRWPSFGTIFVCSTSILLALINNLLSVQSKELGIFTGSSAAILALATSAGAGLGLVHLALFTAIGGVAGYAFAAMRVESTPSDEPKREDSERPSKFKSGGGGDFDGGGADGRY